MGITVYDTRVTHIILRSLQIKNDCYRAVVQAHVSFRPYMTHMEANVDSIGERNGNQKKEIHFYRITDRLRVSGVRSVVESASH